MQKTSKQHPTDQEIIELYWNKDERAIAETERKYGRFLYKIAYGILKNKSDCEECQNDTYLRAWNAIPPEKPATLRLFLAKIMRGTAFDRYEQRGFIRLSRIDDDLTDLPLAGSEHQLSFCALGGLFCCNVFHMSISCVVIL